MAPVNDLGSRLPQAPLHFATPPLAGLMECGEERGLWMAGEEVSEGGRPRSARSGLACDTDRNSRRKGSVPRMATRKPPDGRSLVLLLPATLPTRAPVLHKLSASRPYGARSRAPTACARSAWRRSFQTHPARAGRTDETADRRCSGSHDLRCSRRHTGFHLRTQDRTGLMRKPPQERWRSLTG